MKIPTPKTIKGPIDWGQLLFQLSPLSMKASAVPMAQAVGSGLNKLFTGSEAVPQAATDVGYALRGMTNYNPVAGGLGMRQLIPQAGGYEPTTPREQTIQDISQGLYGGALMAPLMTGGAVGAGFKQLATQTLPKALTYSAGIGSAIKMGQNVAGGQVPAPSKGGGMETLRGLTQGVPEAAGKAMQYGVKLMPLMQGVQLGMEGIAQSVPALNQLTEKGIQSYKPGAGATVAEWLKSVGNVGVRRLVRATLLETPLESLTYGLANKMPKASLIKSIENEVVPNLIYNLGYAGMATADDTLAPMIKDQVSQAIFRLSNPLPADVPAGQEGFIAGAKAPSFEKGAKFVPTFEGENAPPRVLISDKGAKLNIPEVIGKGEKLFVGDVLDHPKLYAEYPDAEIIPVEFDPNTNQSGTYFLGRVPNKIILGTDGRSPTQMKADLLHEIQHTIQVEEGFSQGTTTASAANKLPPDMVGNNEYRNWLNYMAEPGEVEARSVARMQNVGPGKLGTFEPYGGDEYGPTRNSNYPQLSLPLEGEMGIPARTVPLNKGGYRVGSTDIPDINQEGFVAAGKPVTAGEMQQFRQHPLLTEFENAYNAGDKKAAQAVIAKMVKTPEVSDYVSSSQDLLSRSPAALQSSLPPKYEPNIVNWVKRSLLNPTSPGQDLVGDLTMVGLEVQDANALVDLKHQIQSGQAPQESLVPEVERIMSGIAMPIDLSMPVINRENPMSKYQIQSNIPQPTSRDIEGDILGQEKILDQLIAKQDKVKTVAKADQYQREIDGVMATIDRLQAEKEAGYQAYTNENKRAIADFQASPWKKNIDAELKRRWMAGDMSTDNLPGPKDIQSNIPDPRTADWAAATLTNDQASTDEQLRQYFLSSGLRYEQAQRLMELRPQFLSGDLYSTIDGSPLTETVKKIVGQPGVQSNIPEPVTKAGVSTPAERGMVPGAEEGRASLIERALSPVEVARKAVSNVKSEMTAWGVPRKDALQELDSLIADIKSGDTDYYGVSSRFQGIMGRPLRLPKSAIPKR